MSAAFYLNTLKKSTKKPYHAWDEYKDPDKRRDSADREQVAHRVAWERGQTKIRKGREWPVAAER